MNIYTADQIRQADAFTIKNEPISSLDLMERAAKQCTDWIMAHFTPDYSFHVIAGQGNNGGDGLVVARQLAQEGYRVRISIIKFSDSGSPDFESNLKRIPDNLSVEFFDSNFEGPVIDESEILVDAVFGSGLNRPIEGWFAKLVKSINSSEGIVVSIDCPSGLFIDNNENNTGEIVKADFTLTFQFPKLSFLLPSTGAYAGICTVLDIGLSEEFVVENPSEKILLTGEEIAPYLQSRPKFSHKGKFGHALLMAGSKGKIGAAILAGKSVLRSGAGLLTACVPEVGYSAYQSSFPEAMCITSGIDELQDLPDTGAYSAIAFGPGVGTKKETQNLLKLLIQESKIPLVIDADGLNILAENKTWLSYLPAGSVLTPHPGEFRRLVGDAPSDEARLQMLRDFSAKYKSVVVLKGAHTVIASPNGELYFNSTGNPGMATAGSGDVLTGIITGLMSQGYNPVFAACIGVFLHGRAGDLAAEEVGEEALIAGDITEALPRAFLELKSPYDSI